MSSNNSNSTPLTIYLSLTSCPSTPRISLTFGNDGTTTNAAELRRTASDKTKIPLASMKLIFRGRIIPDKSEGDVAKEFKLENECVIHVMGKPTDNLAAAGGGAAGVATNGSSMTAAAGASVTLPSASSATVNSSDASPVKAALVKLRSSNDGPTFRTALTTADKLFGNIVTHPMEDKYRTIKKSNPAFTKRLGGIPGGSDLILAASFTVLNKEGVEYYVLTPSADAWPQLVEAREEVGRVLSEEMNNGAAPPPPAAAGSALPAAGMPNLFPSGMPGGMPGGGMGGGTGNIDAMQSMLSDPNMLQNVMGMMNNPTVQNMMQNNPRFANNPMLQQSLQALQSNPEMMNQFSQMMSNPNVRERMSNLMQQQQQQSGGSVAGGRGADPFSNGPDAMRRQMEQFQQMSQQHGGSSGGFNAGEGVGSGAGEAAAGQSAASTSNNDNNALGGGNDSDMTEEEMIAEAIARSLRES